MLLNVFEHTSSASRSVLCAGSSAHAAHLVHDDVVPALGELPGGLAAGEPAADDVDLAHALVTSRGDLRPGRDLSHLDIEMTSPYHWILPSLNALSRS